MAQLPYLMYDDKPSMSSEKFKELALSLLSKRDRAHLRFLVKNLEADIVASPDSKKKKSGCEFIDSWIEWERTMRLNLARHRSLKIYHDENFQKYADDSKATEDQDSIENAILPVLPADAYAAAAAVFTQDGSPLDGELLLDKARWNAIDLLTGNDYFHENNVYAYYIKLLLLERRQLFNVDDGFSEYKTLYAQIFERSNNGHNSQGEDK